MSEICHPLKGVCIVLSLVEDHLRKKDFISTSLKNEIPEHTNIVFKSAVEENVREDALPIVAYKSGEISLHPFNPQHNIGVVGGTALQVTYRLSFIVSTTSEGLTNELSLEIGALIGALIKDLREVDVYINNINISETQKDEVKYFIQTVVIDMCLGYPVWKTERFRTTLREIPVLSTN